MSFLLTFLARLILLSEPILNKSPIINLKERWDYFLTCLFSFYPIVFVLEQFNWWVSDNKQFGQFMCIALIINMAVGARFHLKFKTFTWKDFFQKNGEMIFYVSAMYVLLEMLRYTAGDNIVGETFRIFIQISTLLYPTSKVAKNLFILTNGKIPTHIIMEKLYDFEKNGDLKQFFGNDK